MKVMILNIGECNSIETRNIMKKDEYVHLIFVFPNTAREFAVPKSDYEKFINKVNIDKYSWLIMFSEIDDSWVYTIN